MTSQKIRGIPSHQAIREIKSEADVKYDRKVVQCFAKVIVPYMLGTLLQLNNGDVALVTHATRSECRVIIVDGSQKGCTLDLYLNPKLFVDKVIDKIDKKPTPIWG
jgi:hypothetical protein